ncbi:hypothetical protein NGM37_32660, partial [Streptomyces sp. TRM76130]|nr:hypothetical protein [Streptomyces sp. TRM76130]
MARLREGVRDGSPLLAPHLLRAALRHEQLRQWFLSTSVSPLLDAPAHDLRSRLARAAEADPAV